MRLRRLRFVTSCRESRASCVAHGIAPVRLRILFVLRSRPINCSIQWDVFRQELTLVSLSCASTALRVTYGVRQCIL